MLCDSPLTSPFTCVKRVCGGFVIWLFDMVSVGWLYSLLKLDVSLAQGLACVQNLVLQVIERRAGVETVLCADKSQLKRHDSQIVARDIEGESLCVVVLKLGDGRGLVDLVGAQEPFFGTPLDGDAALRRELQLVLERGGRLHELMPGDGETVGCLAGRREQDVHPREGVNPEAIRGGRGRGGRHGSEAEGTKDGRDGQLQF